MYDISQMRQLKIRTGLSYQEIADRSGVPLGTVQKVFMGVTTNPRKGTIEKLNTAFTGDLPGMEMRSVLDDGSGTYKPVPYTMLQSGHQMLRDAVRASDASYTDRNENDIVLDRQGHYTIEDLASLPDGVIAELIDGFLYIRSSPATMHQKILNELSFRFTLFIRQNGGACQTYQSPTDVRLDTDDRTMVKPDLIVLCDTDKDNGDYIDGAPDLLVEVLSPSTRSYDLNLKAYKYMNAGVREYWIIDQKHRMVIVYDNTDPEDERIHLYSFSDTIPVAIYGGRMTIDFADICEELGIS